MRKGAGGGGNRAKQVDQAISDPSQQVNCIKLDLTANIQMTYNGQTSFQPWL